MDLPKAYTPHDVEGAIYERWLAADVFAPGRGRLAADPDAAPFVIIQPPPNVTGSLHLGHAQRTAVEDLMIRHARMQRPADAVPARARPRVDRRPVRARPDHRRGRGVAPESRPRALSRADAPVRGRDAADDARPATTGRRLGRLGPPPVHDGRRVGRGGAGGLLAPLRGRAGLPFRGARQLVPRLPDERVGPRGHRHARRPGTLWTIRYHLIDEATGAPDPDATISIATTRPETTPRRHGRGGPPGRRALSRRSSVGGCASRSWIATSRSSPTRPWSAASGRVR